MKTDSKNSIPIFNSPTSTSSDSLSHTLQDSKSTSNLYQTMQQSKKFRQTTYFPTTTKNTNREFLRYTVNLNKSDKQSLQPNIITKPSVRIQRKYTIQENQKKVMEDPQSLNLLTKQNIIQKIIQSKVGNTDKKQQSTSKPSPIPKFLQKKASSNPSVDTPTVKNKTQRIDYTQSTTLSNGQKKTFTPKCNKSIQQQSPLNKITVSYSSNDLLKNKNIKSPTNVSINSSNSIENQKLKYPKLQDFTKIKFLGQGKFGQVYLVQHKLTKSIYAMKQIKKQKIIQNKMQEQLLMEIKMQFYLNHPNILKLYGVFSDQTYIYLILEYMEQGTLYSVLKKKKNLKQADASRKLRDVLDGVNYLHNQMIAHRDIKPENIVISNDVCKICDLGWAAVCQQRRKTLCGTIDYASPQLLQGKQYGIAIDLWCLGVLCYQLMVGKCPFYHISRKQTMKKIINAELSDINIPASIQAQTKDFIYKLLVKNPEQRMSAQKALIHPLITKYYDQDLEDIRNIPKRKL